MTGLWDDGVSLFLSWERRRQMVGSSCCELINCAFQLSYKITTKCAGITDVNGVWENSKGVKARINQATETTYRNFLIILIFTDYSIHKLKI